MIFMIYNIFGICKFTVKYIVAMLCYAKKLRLRHNLLCYCFHRSVSDCPVEARRSREKKGFFLAAISKFRSWQKLEFLEKILEFLEKSPEIFEILEFFLALSFFKMSKKSLEVTLDGIFKPIFHSFTYWLGCVLHICQYNNNKPWNEVLGAEKSPQIIMQAVWYFYQGYIQ